MNIQTEQIFDYQGERRKKTRIMKKSVESVPAFLQKTYEILENSIYEEIVSWNEEGDSFIVKKVNEFSELILPKYFKHSNFASFVRQLNMYDFHKNRNETNENEFKHKLFLRGCKSLLPQIRRKSGDQSPPQQQLVLKVNSDKPFTEFNELVNEMAVLANKQTDLEKLIKILIKQNEKFQKDNKYLWNELMKNKQKTENQQERVLLWFLQSLSQPKTQTNSKQQKSKSLLMIGDEPPIPHSQDQESIFKKILGCTNGEQGESVEESLDGLSKKQILQGLLQAFSFKHSNNKTINNLLSNKQLTEDEDSSSMSDNEIPFQSEEFMPPKLKKVKREQSQVEQSQQFYSNEARNQLMLYQDGKNSYSKIFQQYPSVTNYGNGKISHTKQNGQMFKQESKCEDPFNYQNEYNGQDYLRSDDYISEFLNRKDSMSANMFNGGEQNSLDQFTEQ